jgi:ferric-dicitrate binding protein FerR (iron transport regulator)
VVTPEAVRHRVVLFCVTVAKQTWRYRVEVLLATLSGLLIQGGVVWLHSRLFPRPSIYVHANAPRNAARTLRLPDESQVVLAPGSQLSYTSWFTPHDERELSLTGEGTFAVARGARAALVLAARGIEVSASAARFTVRADETDSVAHVIVHEGLVRVRALTASGGGNALTLNAGEGVRVGPRLQVMRENWSVLFHR